MCYSRRFFNLRVSTCTTLLISHGIYTHRFIVGLRTKCPPVDVAPGVVLLPMSVTPSLRRKDQVATLAGPVAFRLMRRHVLVGWDEAIA